MVLILILSSLITFSFAQTDTVGCCSDKARPGFAEKYLEWWAATNRQIKNAKCQVPGKPSYKEMLNYINRKASEEKASETVNGVELKDEDPRLIYLFKKLTTFENSYFDENKKHNTFKVPASCHKALCALESILGKSIALKTMYFLDRYELNLSHVTHKDLAAWKSSEMDLILESVDDLPAHLIPYEKNKYLKHYKRGWGPGENVVANAAIEVYSVWEQLDSDQERMSAMIHEIGHNIGDRMKQDESQEWLDISGWVEKDGKWTSSKRNQLVSKYGGTNPAEDFAETFVAYRYSPATLKKISPKKYQHMKERVFLGLEYTSEEKCQDKNSDFAKLRAEINVAELPLPETFKNCKSELNLITYQEEVNPKACIKKTKIVEELKKKTEGMDKVKRDAILAAANFEDIDASDISDEEELQAHKNIVGDLYGSIAKEFNNFTDDCSTFKEYGWQDLGPFNELHFNDKYSYINEKKINDHIYKICMELKRPEHVSCKDLLPYMKKHLPKRLYQEKIERKNPAVYHHPVADNTRVRQTDYSRLLSQKAPPFKETKGFRCPFP